MHRMTGSARKLQIVTAPHPALSEVAAPIEDLTDPKVVALAKRMIRLCRNSNGIGLAANQVGLPVRMIVTDVRQSSMRLLSERPHTCHRDARVYINPQLDYESPTKETDLEGCLSLPGVRVEVARAIGITITYTDLFCIERRLDCKGLYARCILHEMDHLNGIQITDHASETGDLR